MKYERIASEKNVATFEVKIDEKEWQQTLDNVAEKSKSNFKVQGFRQGKAPRRMIEQNYGKDVFYEDAINELANKCYIEILNAEKEIEPIQDPELYLKKVDDSGLEFGIKIELKPEIIIGSYKNLEVTVDPVEVTEEEVKNTLNDMQKRYTRTVEVTDRNEAKMGDTVVIDFEGSVNGVKFDGGSSKDYELELGSHSFIDTFEDQIVGMKIDETKDIKVKFPHNYTESLKDKDAVFSVKVNKIKGKEIPELNDEFASNVSEFDTLEEYTKSIKEELIEYKNNQRNIELENKLIQTIVDSSKIELTNGIINRQVEIMFHEYEHQLSHQGLNMDDYLKFMKKSKEDFKKDLLPEAEKRLRTSFVLQEIVKKENIKVEKKEVDERIIELATKNGKTKEEFEKEMHSHTLDDIVNGVVIEKLMKILKENNNLK